jgi:HlyD family secretion protein
VKKLLIFLILVALGLTALASYTKYSASHSREVPFETARVEFGDLREIINVSARLAPFDSKLIFTRIPGQIVQLNADFGAEVEEGQVLARLDDRNARLKLREAKAALESAGAGVAAANADLEKAKTARDEAERYLKEVKDYPAASRTKLDLIKAEGPAKVAAATVKTAEEAVKLAQARVKQAEEAVGQAEYGLELTTIRVPAITYAGDDAKKPALGEVKPDSQAPRDKRKYVVLDRKVELGQNVDTKEPMFILAATLKDLQAHAMVPESQIGRIGRGQEASFWVDALGEDRKLPARVTEIRPMPMNLQGAVQYQVLLNVNNVKQAKSSDWALKPGMTAQVEIMDRTHRNVWKLPVNAKNFTLDDAYLTPEAKEQAAKAESRLDMRVWTKVWTLKDKKPWPIFVRVGGVNAQNEPGIKDAGFYEILEWDPEWKPTPDPKKPETIPEMIIGAPPAKKGGFLELPNIKF